MCIFQLKKDDYSFFDRAALGCQNVSGSFFGIKRSKGYVKDVTVKQNHGSSLFTLC